MDLSQLTLPAVSAPPASLSGAVSPTMLRGAHVLTPHPPPPPALPVLAHPHPHGGSHAWDGAGGMLGGGGDFGSNAGAGMLGVSDANEGIPAGILDSIKGERAALV